LRQWTPRRPSPELRRRLFRPHNDAVAIRRARIGFADLSRWFVPAFGCFLLVVGTLSGRYPAHGAFPLGHTNVLLSDNSPGYNDLVLASHSDHSDINSLPARIRLAASNGVSAGLSEQLTPFPSSYTNKLIQ
jgi:hypothetical protein